MKVLKGWSSEVSRNDWRKFDVELDEEDLKRLLVSAEIDPSRSTDIPFVYAYLLLSNQAEAVLFTSALDAGVVSEEVATKSVVEAKDAVSKILARIKEDLG